MIKPTDLLIKLSAIDFSVSSPSQSVTTDISIPPLITQVAVPAAAFCTPSYFSTFNKLRWWQYEVEEAYSTHPRYTLAVTT